MCIRVKPSHQFCAHNPLRIKPDTKAGECVRYKSVKVGLKRFIEFVSEFSVRSVQEGSMLLYYDAADRLCAQLIWNPNEVGPEFCEHRLLLKAK